MVVLGAAGGWMISGVKPQSHATGGRQDDNPWRAREIRSSAVPRKTFRAGFHPNSSAPGKRKRSCPWAGRGPCRASPRVPFHANHYVQPPTANDWSWSAAEAHTLDRSTYWAPCPFEPRLVARMGDGADVCMYCLRAAAAAGWLLAGWLAGWLVGFSTSAD